MAVDSATMSIVTMKEKTRYDNDALRIEKYTLADDLPTKFSQLGLQPCAIAAEASYSIRTLTEHDRETVLQFFRRFFFRDEPMNLAVQLLETPDSRCPDLEHHVCKTLGDGISLAAVDDKGEIVGIIINGIARREDEGGKGADECTDAKFQRILRVLEHIDTEAHVWKKVPEDCHTIVEINIASTHSAWRGQGLMRVLCEETERLARNIGAGAIRIDTTSAFSAAAAERLHYRQLYSVFYADLPFAPKPPPPHTEARVYIKEL